MLAIVATYQLREVQETSYSLIVTLNSISQKFFGGKNYLNTSNYGLFPKEAIENIQLSATALGNGSFDTQTRDDSIEASRAYFANIIGQVQVSQVSTGCSVSPYVGLVANSLPDGSKVLIAEDDFTSLTMPFAIQKGRLDINEVPLNRFIDSIDNSYAFAAVSAVQSSNGSTIDLDALAEKRNKTGTKVLVDATQSAGCLPMEADKFDIVICSAYKWLLCPRGVAFGYFSQELIESILPINVGWFSSNNSHSAYYGSDMAISLTARKFDISPSGLNWIGAEPALRLLLDQGIETIHDHNVSVANEFCEMRGMPETNSAIVTTPIDSDTIHKLNKEGIQFGVQEGKREGFARFSFHLYNSSEDAALAASCFD